MRFRTRVGRVLIAILAVATAVPLLSTQAQAQSAPRTVNDAMVPLTDDPGGPLLFKLDYWINRPKDNLIAMVGGASRYRGLKQSGGYHAKYRWMSEWDSTDAEMVWTVEVARTTKFNVRLNMSSGPGDQFVLDVPGTSNNLRFGPSPYPFMDMLEPGTITIPAGRHELRLRKSRAGEKASLFKAIELIRSSDYPAYQKRVEDFQADMSWMQGARGYMVQWGGWSYPRFGNRGTVQDVWNEFDVDKFVNEMAKAKVDYVVWSVSWVDYLFPGPIKAIDTIVGPGGDDRTADRDLLMEIGRGLRSKGIDLAIYYHVGHGLPRAASWWDQQNWPTDTFKKNAYGDRTVFFNNWKSVIGEVGKRYNKLIKGFFFDDGLTYYPADFEELGAVARTGNPDRFISYNSFAAARYTDFQDVNFGEATCVGKVDFEGRHIDGPHKGLLEHCMTRVHNEWGNYGKDWPTPGYVQSPETYAGRAAGVAEQGAISIANMMFNGPTFVDKDRDGKPGDGNLNMGLALDVPKNWVEDIELDADGKLYARSNRGIFDLDPYGRWKGFSAPRADDFGSQRSGTVYTLDAGYLMRGDGNRNSERLGNDGFVITKISVGADGSVYGLTDKGDLIRWTGGKWRSITTNMTGLTDVSVGKDYKNVWLLDANGKPFHYNGSRVTDYSGTTRTKFKQVESATNGELFAIATDGSLYQWRNRTWTKRTEVKRVSDVTATSQGDFWFIDADNHWIGHVKDGAIVEAARGAVR